MTREKMHRAWEAFDAGNVGSLQDSTLKAMLAEAEAGEVYLSGRGDSLMVFKVRLDISRLKDILTERKAQVQKEKRRLHEKYGPDLSGLCGLPPGEFPALERAGR